MRYYLYIQLTGLMQPKLYFPISGLPVVSNLLTKSIWQRAASVISGCWKSVRISCGGLLNNRLRLPNNRLQKLPFNGG